MESYREKVDALFQNFHQFANQELKGRWVSDLQDHNSNQVYATFDYFIDTCEKMPTKAVFFAKLLGSRKREKGKELLSKEYLRSCELEAQVLDRMKAYFKDLPSETQKQLLQTTKRRMLESANSWIRDIAKGTVKQGFNFRYIRTRELCWTTAKQMGDQAFMDLFPKSFCSLPVIDHDPFDRKGIDAKGRKEREGAIA